MGEGEELDLGLPNGRPRATESAELCHQRCAAGGLFPEPDRAEAFWKAPFEKEPPFFGGLLEESKCTAAFLAVSVESDLRGLFGAAGRDAESRGEAGRTSRMVTVSGSEVAAARVAPSGGRRRCA